MTPKDLRTQFGLAVTEAASYITMVQRLDDARYCRWNGQSEDGRKYSRHYGKQVFPWEGASDTRQYFIDDLVNDDVDLMRTADRNCHMQCVGTNSNNDEFARAATAVLDYVGRTMLSRDADRERTMAANWRQHYGSAVVGVDWLIENDSELVTVGIQDLMALAQRDQALGNLLGYVFQNLQAGKSLADIPPDDIKALISKFTQYFPGANPQKCLPQLMREGKFEYSRPYVRVDRPCVTALRTFQDVFFFRSIGDIQRAPWIVRRDVLPKASIENRALVEQWDPAFTKHILNSAGQSWLWNMSRGVDNLTRFGSRLYTDEMNYQCEFFYGFFRGQDENGHQQTQVMIFHPGTDIVGRQLPLPYVHGQYPFVLLKRENRSRSAYESRGVGDMADTAQAELKTQRDARNDRTSFATIPPLMVPLGRGKQQYKLGPAAQLGVNRPGELGWLAPPPMDQSSFDTENWIRRDMCNYFGKTWEGVDPNKVLRKQQRLVDDWLDEMREVHIQVFQLCCQFLPIEQWQQICGDPNFQMPLSAREWVQNNMTLILEFDARDLNMEYVQQKLELINTMLVPSDAAGVIDRAGLTEYALNALDPALAKRLIKPQGQVTQQEITDEQGNMSKIVSGVEPPVYQDGQNAQLRLQVIQNTMQNQDFMNFVRQNPLAMQRLQNRVKNFQFQLQQQQNAQTGKIGVAPPSINQIAGTGPAPAAQ